MGRPSLSVPAATIRLRSAGDNAGSPRKIVVFGFDAAESSQIRRINSFLDAGYDLVAFTMRRGNMNAGLEPHWRNIHLATVPNEQLLRRAAIMALSCLKIAWHRREMADADVLVARNFDLLVLAYVARCVALRPRLPIVYECLDIHGSFAAPSRKGRFFRAVERWLLRRTSLLVVSSPGFVANYFRPLQHYDGPTQLVENKIWFGDAPPQRRASADNLANGDPWVLGWVGSLRCEPSFRILLEAAERLGSRVRIEMHGNVHRHVVNDFEARIAAHPNITYHGPYGYPDGLRDVYARCDFVWAQDLWQSGMNSDWLLPNRIYEASYFGCLSIAVATTETGRKVERDRLGYTVPVASADALVALLETLRPEAVEADRRALLAHDPADFVYDRREIEAVVERAIASSADIPRSSSRGPTE